MKRPRLSTRLICAFQITLITLMPLMSADALAESCDQICSDVDTRIKQDEQTKCSANAIAIPQSNPNDQIGANLSQQLSTIEQQRVASCKQQINQTYGQIKSHCVAYNADQKGTEMETINATIYTLAAAVCITSCVLQMSVVTIEVGVAMEPYCTYGAIGAGIADVGMSLIMKDYMNAAIGGMVAAGAGMAAGGVSIGSTTFTMEGGACFGGVMLGIIAGLKWATIPKNNDNKSSECSIIQQLLAATNYNVGNNPDIRSLSGPPPGSIAGGYNGPTGAPGSNSNPPLPSTNNPKNGGDLGNNTKFADLVKKPDGLNSLAAIANNDSLLGKNPNQPHMMEVLKKAGIDPKELVSKLDTTSPNAAMGSIGGMPPNVKGVLEQIDADIASGKLNASMLGDLAKTTNTGGAGGGGGKGKQASNPFGEMFSFGKKADPSAGAAGLGFSTKTGNTATGPVGEDNDIWHAGTKLSIFQIVSKRYDRSCGKVEKLEWTSPMNRALLGLPQKSGNSTQKGK